MRKNDSITFEIDKRDLEVVLGNLSLTIAKMERTQEALKGIVEIVRTALQEAENPKDISPTEEAEKDEDDEDEAESLAIELLKAVFSALTDVFENGE